MGKQQAANKSGMEKKTQSSTSDTHRAGVNYNFLSSLIFLAWPNCKKVNLKNHFSIKIILVEEKKIKYLLWLFQFKCCLKITKITLNVFFWSLTHVCKDLSWSQHSWVCPTQHRELLVGKIWNLNRQEQEGAQKEMSHPNSQSRAGAELGAEPGPAAHQPGQIWGRTLIFNFPVQISSLFPLRSSQYSHSLGKSGVISACCFFTPVKWDFLPFISSKLWSTHPPVNSESQGCLQHK